MFRIHSSGGQDTKFPSLAITNLGGVIAFQKDGKFLVAGGFTNLAGFARSRIVGADWSNGVFNATLQTDAGKNYSLEFKDTLSDPARTSLPLLEGDGTLKALFDPAANGVQRFYRARVE